MIITVLSGIAVPRYLVDIKRAEVENAEEVGLDEISEYLAHERARSYRFLVLSDYYYCSWMLPEQEDGWVACP